MSSMLSNRNSILWSAWRLRARKTWSSRKFSSVSWVSLASFWRQLCVPTIPLPHFLNGNHVWVLDCDKTVMRSRFFLNLESSHVASLLFLHWSYADLIIRLRLESSFDLHLIRRNHICSGTRSGQLIIVSTVLIFLFDVLQDQGLSKLWVRVSIVLPGLSSIRRTMHLTAQR